MRPRNSALVNSDAATALTQRLSIERYKGTIKGLTQFGGRERAQSAIGTRSTGLRSNSEVMAVSLPDLNTPMPHRPYVQIRWFYRISRAGGGRRRGIQAPTPPNLNPNDQPDPKLRNLNWRCRSPVHVKKYIAPRQARRTRTKCTSSARIWMAGGLGKLQMTTGRERPW